ncbi:MAG TPA: tRNA preQ1(34) S-adenosylmethionine ribosyltransferase-isomerase QueA [Vicinamibacteria bacterium]|nr:tRNA preQ1(34) S-adenosylmethionine ribosyltransferase-isomerase QueA [Vicinamibacteria bacterium]
MRIAEFDYPLPPASIAQEAIEPRDAARLMRLPRTEGTPTDHVFRDLPRLLRPGDLLVVNRSRVFPARLLGRRDGGGAAEVFLLREVGDERWEALVRPGRRLRPGAVISIDGGLSAVVEAAAVGTEGRRVVHLRAESGPLEAALERAGHVPLPPYIRRPDRPDDRARYQTVYAREKGSVAAPTAGLHFTPSVLDALRAAGLGVAELVLHVGPGTFRPVTAAEVEDHRLEPEPYLIPAETAEAIAAARTRGGRVIAVGTTVVRALEAAARNEGTVSAGAGETALVVRPGFTFRIVDALITNFHLPRSSLLLLVAAFAGRERVLDAYEEAVRRGYRFYSYGDAMLLE